MGADVRRFADDLSAWSTRLGVADRSLTEGRLAEAQREIAAVQREMSQAHERVADEAYGPLIVEYLPSGWSIAKSPHFLGCMALAVVVLALVAWWH